MPQFYFDFQNGTSRIDDEEGVELEDLETGRREALRTLGEVAREALSKGDEQTLRASIRDANGHVAYTATVTVTGTWHPTSIDLVSRPRERG
ncbi:hypothetical protein ASF58_24185 [Methylobacterium sp. Leaf125]|uniref:DUF6894 family protein n=1 Tax=Methylobacterium sp. Leaf125 TaxID=1736265 RepID=UPI0006F972E3|nr:hypothetical protein [Methylobacterium sp. Leaf125]KQQ33232.1 hypothetical protein ASF58_24185 [Methylobacterium sp. Leaf125]